jgi:hypothetical protein
MLFETKEKILNWLISHSPFWVQYLFMERVMKSVKASLRAEEAHQVLLTEEEGNLRGRRPNQPLDAVRVVQLDMLQLSQAHQQISTFSELLRSDRRAYHAARTRRYPHMG